MNMVQLSDACSPLFGGRQQAHPCGLGVGIPAANAPEKRGTSIAQCVFFLMSMNGHES